MGEKWVGGPIVECLRAYLFFLHSLMGKKKKFAGATAPPSHYVASPLLTTIFALFFSFLLVTKGTFSNIVLVMLFKYCENTYE